ncbi:MAG: hypothetical protein JXA71_16085 [Chitinispirillaceae bacterium]|nr:hypothetical protein [Chitinispirillaceae bacterium]
MKIQTAILFCLAGTLSFAEVRYGRIDMLHREQGIDLDSGLVRVTGYIFGRPSPYLPGSMHDPLFNADFALSPQGLLWCNCDGNGCLTFFPTNKCNVPFKDLIALDSLPLSDTTLFNRISELPVNTATFRVPDTGGLYLIQTNQGRIALFRIIRRIIWDVDICGIVQRCPMALEIEWWYQDNGSTDFRDLTRLTERQKKRTLQSLNSTVNRKWPRVSGRYIPIYDLRGRKVSASVKRESIRAPGVYFSGKPLGRIVVPGY